MLHLEMGRHFGLLYPQDNINTKFTSSKTPISRSDTPSQLSLVVALLSIYSLCWECALLFIIFSENVGLGIYCHRVLVLEFSLQKTPDIYSLYPSCFCCSKHKALVLTDGCCPRPRGHIPEQEAAMLRLD